MVNNDFLLLVSKSFSGEASLQENEQLEQLIQNDPAFMKHYCLLKQYWEQQAGANPVAVEESLQKVLTRLNLPSLADLEPAVRQMPFIRRRVLAIAATVAVLLAISFFILHKNAPKKEEGAELAKFEKKQNSKGVKSNIQLADGSMVWLNADSRIEYPKQFEGNTREIYLHGEAFFEVAKNPQKPFIIHLANGTVRVLGTSFNVRAYDNEKVVETSVSTGKVAFIPKYTKTDKKEDTVFITPNNKVRYLFNAEEISVLPTAAKDDKAWTEGRLIFKAMSLEDISQELERYFGKKTRFLDDEAKGFVLTGSFQNNSLDEIMYYLSLSKTRKFYYKLTSDELLISTSETEF